MKTFLRQRKNKQLAAEKTYKILTFRLQQLEKLWFGFPLNQVLRVIIGQQQYYNPRQPDIIMTSYQGEEVVIIDVDQYIFKKYSSQLPIIKDKHLLLFENEQNNHIIGLPIDSPPQILDVKKSELKKLPPQFQKIGNITSLSNKIVQRQNHPVYIMLSPHKMIINN
jgi:purine-binding chemotaxis protein CheW